jgi:hypothetical protein
VPIPSPFRLTLLAIAALGCGGHTPTPVTAAGSPPPKEPIKPLGLAAFAGQEVTVTPITLVVPLDTLAGRPPFADHGSALSWADSLVGEVLAERGPEVKWVLPPELRKVARRAPTIAPDPDRMGQSLMRERSFDVIPDPLRSNLRTLAALVGGRWVLIPASVAVLSEKTGQVRAEVTLVLADTRTGKVVWRTVSWGIAATPTRALRVAMETVLPI